MPISQDSTVYLGCGEADKTVLLLGRAPGPVTAARVCKEHHVSASLAAAASDYQANTGNGILENEFLKRSNNFLPFIKMICFLIAD